ncbi:2-hydroxy-3-oxopropionate reductase [Shinella sp.]|uniref:2-hydroxy-3-oxopropionate reductase n=1 Tax=Shinella sp. TaxID=1870904 RepID=UPI0039E51D72
MNIGFIGLGVMGAPMAGHLLDAGHTVHASINRAPAPAGLLTKGLQVQASPREVGARCEVVIAMLPNTPDVERVLFEQGLAEALAAGSLFIDMSSIDPVATKKFAEKLREKDVLYLDAPVSGGEVGAKNATLSIMCGGPAEAFERAMPLLQAMGRNITHVGEENGSGQTCKIANQIVVALTIEAVGEALVFARQSGCDPAKVREALMGGFAASRILEVHGQRMIDRAFQPGFRISLHAKDLDLALKAAGENGIPLPGTALCRQLLASARANGDWEKDHSAIVKSLERLAGADPQ